MSQGEVRICLDISPLATACLSCGCRLETAMTKTLSYYHHCLMSKLACLFTIFNLVPFKHQTLSDSDRNNLNRSQFFIKFKENLEILYIL